MKRMKNGADVESADSESCGTWVKFNVTREEKKSKNSGTAETEGALGNEK